MIQLIRKEASSKPVKIGDGEVREGSWETVGGRLGKPPSYFWCCLEKFYVLITGIEKQATVLLKSSTARSSMDALSMLMRYWQGKWSTCCLIQHHVPLSLRFPAGGVAMAKNAEIFLQYINAEILRIVLRGRENDASKPKPNTTTQFSSAMTPCTVLALPLTDERIEEQKTIPCSTLCLCIAPKLDTLLYQHPSPSKELPTPTIGSPSSRYCIQGLFGRVSPVSSTSQSQVSPVQQ
ncbi:hypothetical protein F5879DRAFT_704659 [Lentinula edodes]|nr:hypothetical protein F5879DRAFT_704659 [Lentinula edodes]